MICDHDGRILRVLRDDLGPGSGAAAGVSFMELVDPGVREKAQRFLKELQTLGAAFDWEITVPVEGVLTPVHFAGARVEDGFLIVIAGSRSGLSRVNEELMLINNEQTNALRSALKEISLRARPSIEPGNHEYDELTRLNNELANVQREMARKNAELERVNEQKNRFVGMAAHDLRSPLGVILNYAEFLEAEAVLTPEQRDFVTVIKRTSRFMLGLVDDLLDVSTIEAGRLELNREPTDLVALVEHTVMLNRTLASPKQITIAFHPPVEPLAPMLLDPGKMQQVLNNLISNAVKFSPPGSAVDVAMEVTGDQVMIGVRDQGPGIADDQRAKLFKPFSKTGARPTGGERSTGLGLMIVQRIVQGHGGEVRVESVVGAGSKFIVVLPRVSAAA